MREVTSLAKTLCRREFKEEKIIPVECESDVDCYLHLLAGALCDFPCPSINFRAHQESGAQTRPLVVRCSIPGAAAPHTAPGLRVLTESLN